ncbi:helix-turn-helix domain-containing protein [Chryseobacterium sp. 2R14A]|uniref:helix-turn-helix domain-containing protein n=1 Tax=Chryseobacterium sp. 2R14A TaxID=3380353 RepID=UPI003CE9B934
MNEIKKLELSKVKALEEMNLLNIQESNEKAERIINTKNNWVISLLITSIVLIIIVFIVIWVYKFKIKKKHAESKLALESVKKRSEIIEADQNQKKEENLEKSKYLTDVNGFIEIQKKLLKLEHKKEFLNPEFKLSYLAKKMGTNTTYLSAFFNDFLKKGFSQYVQEKRIEYLLNLLKHESIYHKYTVQAISEHIGYKSVSAFTKIFKKHTGVNFSFYLEGLKVISCITGFYFLF